jgi:hypothetical protein
MKKVLQISKSWKNLLKKFAPKSDRSRTLINGNKSGKTPYRYLHTFNVKNKFFGLNLMHLSNGFERGLLNMYQVFQYTLN